jgi:hypothetical protein
MQIIPAKMSDVFPDRPGCDTFSQMRENCRRLLLLDAICPEPSLVMIIIEIYLARELKKYQACAPDGEPKEKIPLQEEVWATLTNTMLAAGPSAWISYNKPSCQVSHAALSSASWTLFDMFNQDVGPRPHYKSPVYNIRANMVQEVIDLSPICPAPDCQRALFGFDHEDPRLRQNAEVGRQLSVHANFARRAPRLRALPELLVDIGNRLQCPWNLFTIVYHPAIRNMFPVLGQLIHFDPCKLGRGKLSISSVEVNQ